MGKVKRIDFSWNEYEETQPGYIVVEFEMRDNVTPLPPGEVRTAKIETAIRQGLRARLKSQGITGTSILSLEYLNPVQNPPAGVPWTPKHAYIPAAPGQFSELLASIERSLRNIERLDFASISEMLQGSLKSVGHILDRVDQVDFGGISTNANSLVTELRSSNTRLKSFIEDTDDTVKRMKLEKLTQEVTGLVGQLRGTVAELEPGLARIDFGALNQTLVNASRAIHDVDDALLELKQYPSGFLFGKPPPPLKVVQPSANK